LNLSEFNLLVAKNIKKAEQRFSDKNQMALHRPPKSPEKGENSSLTCCCLENHHEVYPQASGAGPHDETKLAASTLFHFKPLPHLAPA
jgi:hypothetical protein